VTPLPAGRPVNAVIFEDHLGLLGNETSTTKEVVSQTLLGSPIQALFRTRVGTTDRFSLKVACGQ